MNTSLVALKPPVVSETLIPSVLLLCLSNEENNKCQLFLPSSQFQGQSSTFHRQHAGLEYNLFSQVLYRSI